MRHGMKLKSSVLFLALMAGMWGCSDSDDSGEGKALQVTTFEELQEACRMGGISSAPKEVALAADIRINGSLGRLPLNGAGVFVIDGSGYTVTYRASQDQGNYYWGTTTIQNTSSDITFTNMNFVLSRCYFFFSAFNSSSITLNDVKVEIERDAAVTDEVYRDYSYIMIDGKNSKGELNEGTTLEKKDGIGSVLSVQNGATVVFNGGKVLGDDFIRFTSLDGDGTAIIFKRALENPLEIFVETILEDTTEAVDFLVIRGENYTLTASDLALLSLQEDSYVRWRGKKYLGAGHFMLYLDEAENAIKLRFAN